MSDRMQSGIPGGGSPDRPDRAGRSRLTRERVLNTALAVVDEVGLASLSMRRVADELGVEPMALYRYTPSKDDLLDGLVETLFLALDQALADGDYAIPPSRPGTPEWRADLHKTATAMYRVALAHPHVVPLVATRPLTVPLTRRPQGVLRSHERLLALLHSAGLEDRTALTVYRTFLSWVLGYIVIELRQIVDDPDEPEPAIRLGLHRLPASDFPRLRALGPALATPAGEQQLTAGIDALLDHLVPQT
ncbi:TetR/AcrR family transcriptional regulator [Streptomyces sporangiiformans]|uniref:TetR/AcrR family transcriptional regulator n=1 Tax=Streptomyces sporangiiformans TaxID=2315329 RepID=A0A505DR96_9ACTN|nr:TetR/AcrR family transcriptional regulator [Streptomyces sporangiiformans]TPQ23632.1 TetR/AcrR family transcriptional regulator [Streptomyces sporangiiformans]